jgi:hypothetical protein
MNELALIAIGLLFGVVLSVVAIAAGTLFYVSVQMRRESTEAKRDVAAAIQLNTIAIDKMRGEVGLALSQMDAQRLYEASVAIQKVSKLLHGTVSQLNKVVYAAVPPGLDMGGPQTPGFTLEEEAADDARMLEERRRWQAEQTVPSVSPEAVSDFFEQRRRNGIYSVGSTPPATGAYQAVAEQQPERPVETLPDIGGDDDLTGQGEL